MSPQFRTEYLATREEERTTGVLAKPGPEERTLTNLLHDELLDLGRRERQVAE